MRKLSFNSFSLPKHSPFFLYLAMILFITIGDGTMSYYAPVVMERTLESATQMGLVLALSSTFGMFVDFFFAKTFGNKKSTFFNKILVAFMFFFPLSFLFYQAIPSFIFAMFAWGVYFESIVFSNYHAVHEYVDNRHHAWAWGLLSLMKNIGWVIGPFMAGELDKIDPTYPLFFSMGAFSIGALLFGARTVLHKRMTHKPEVVEAAPIHHTFAQEIKIWKVYGKALWPLLGMTFLFLLIDSTFFSIGPLLAEDLATIHPMGGLFITMYTVPAMIFALFAGFFAKFWGKKRSAFLFGCIAGVFLIMMSQLKFLPFILLFTFIASAAISLMFTELTAAFEDYVVRSCKFGNDIIGLTAIMGSIGYIVGPAMNGFLGDQLGNQFVFGIWGALLFVISFMSFFIVKRKVRLPFHEAEEVSGID